MPVNPNFTNANATTPFASGGGGLNPTFDNVSINQGGSITMGSSLYAGVYQKWNKDVSGTNWTGNTMAYFGGVQPSNLALQWIDQAGNMDSILAGDLTLSGKGVNVYSGYNGFQMGLSGTSNFGFRLVNQTNSNVAATLADLGGTTWNLYNLSTINAGSNTANAVALMSSLKATFPSNFS